MSDAVYERLKSDGGEPEGELRETLAASAVHAGRLAPELLAACGPNRFIVHNVNFPAAACAAATPFRPPHGAERGSWCPAFSVPRRTTARTG